MAKYQCSECDKMITGKIVWWRPFGNMVQVDPQTYQFIATAVETAEDGQADGLPFHPKCFTARTGEKWPPDKK